MASFKTCIQYIRSDRASQVYIRVTHNKKVGYIPTGKYVLKEFVKKNKEIKDPYILSYCSNLIMDYSLVELILQNIYNEKVAHIADI